MNLQTDSARLLARARAVPDTDALRNELASVLSQAPAIRARQNRARNTIENVWDGQSDDYRKHEVDLGEEAKPFEGAPDLRVPVVDTVTRERVALFVEALCSGEIHAKPIGGLDQGENAVKMSRTLRWLRENRMQELEDEAELLANYVLGDDPGTGVLKIWWKRELALELRDLTLDDVGMEILTMRGIEIPQNIEEATNSDLTAAAGAIADITDLIFNPMREQEALDTMALAFPSVQAAPLRRALKQLRRTQTATLPLPYVKENRPCVAALRFMRDIYFPPDVDDITKARIVWELEWVSEADLRGRVHAEHYKESWVEAVIDAGPGGDETDTSFLIDSTWNRSSTVTGRAGESETEKLFPIWHAYAKASDGYGIAGIYWTVYSAKVRDDYGYHELLDYPDGEVPFVLFRAEIVKRGVENARGMAAAVGSLQADIKRMRDSRGAHEMLATVPPVRVAERRGALEAVLGPMVEVPVREADDVTWMNPPAFPNTSIEMEKSAWLDLNQYLGRLVPGVPQQLAEAIVQRDVNRWLKKWRLAFNKIQELQQEFGDPVEMQLVAGGPLHRYTSDEIRGRFMTSITFSVRDLDIDFVVSRNQAIASVLQNDVEGNIDRTVIARAGLRAIDPNLAEQAIRDPQVVTQKEMEDERMAVGMLANGVEAPLRRSGINAKLRLQALVETVNGSQVLARRYYQPATPDDLYFQELVNNRQKNLQFLVQQYGAGADNNRAIGLQGTAPMQLAAGTTSQQPT